MLVDPKHTSNPPFDARKLTEALSGIRAFWGSIPDEEYELRRQIRTCRNAAAFKRHDTQDHFSQTLCWMTTRALYLRTRERETPGYV